MTHRLVEIDPERLVRWVDGFGARHGAPSCDVRDGALLLSAPDGATAVLEVPWPGEWVTADDRPVVGLAAYAAAPRTALLVLVRRGGFAAGVSRDGDLLDHATGTRHVQGRTAAGGWSQQRFARRRGNQTDVLAGAAADLVLKVVARTPSAGAGAPTVLVPGGDRTLVAAVLGDPRLAAVAALPRGALLDVPDPRLRVLVKAARRARAVRVRVDEP